MNIEFLIQKNKGNDPLHARFIFNKAGNISFNGIDITAALCMENKK
ncbi:MAG: hypothetical protein FWF92_11630 [Oscillospiraceae bacterium]|nr:hypothetical protein [Oscillospiraceae bacterium]